MGNFVRISVQLQAHQNKLLPCAAAGAETARIAAILGETYVLIQHSCGGILDHDVQFQLGIPCRFGALDTGLSQGAADAPAPMGPVDTDAELGAVAQLLLTAYGGYAGGADDFAADNSADFNTVGAGSGLGEKIPLIFYGHRAFPRIGQQKLGLCVGQIENAQYLLGVACPSIAQHTGRAVAQGQVLLILYGTLLSVLMCVLINKNVVDFNESTTFFVVELCAQYPNSR